MATFPCIDESPSRFAILLCLKFSWPFYSCRICCGILLYTDRHTGSHISLAWIADFAGARRLAGGEQVLRPYVATKTSFARTQSVISNPSSMPDTSCIRHWSTAYCFFSSKVSPFPSQACSASAVQCCAAGIFMPRQVAGKPGSQLVGGGVRSGLRRRSG